MFLGAMKRYSYTNISIQILANNTIHAANKEQFDNTFKQTIKNVVFCIHAWI